VRPQHDHQEHLQHGQQRPEQSQCRDAKSGDLDGAIDGQRGMPGKKEIVADGIGDEERGKTRIAPDDPRRRWQRDHRLAQLAQGEQAQQPQNGLKLGPTTA
jgi:hypothetical protein